MTGPPLLRYLKRQLIRLASTSSAAMTGAGAVMETNILPVDVTKIGALNATPVPNDVLDALDLHLDDDTEDAANLRRAALQLRSSDIPVAFPTETVYGLGADATRSAAVRGIYKAKQRPSDNPLIVHFHSLRQLRLCLLGASTPASDGARAKDITDDPIPAIYKPLIQRFWPGPLTLILPNSPSSPLAPEVTAGLDTFGARIPKHPLALALLKLADVPVAAPSANASTKPSPTAAEHVAYDLQGRIETIIDGGPCDVGVESTVVNGLCSPPLILRPGGVSLEQIRTCSGWKDTEIGYGNVSENTGQPKAPGMKYRHYSPKATVVLCETQKSAPTAADLKTQLGPKLRLGIIRTRRWKMERTEGAVRISQHNLIYEPTESVAASSTATGFSGMLEALQASSWTRSTLTEFVTKVEDQQVTLLDIYLGPDVACIARGIFSALRDLDRQDVDAIFVEGIDDFEGDTAAAVMNRLRKAAEIRLND